MKFHQKTASVAALAALIAIGGSSGAATAADVTYTPVMTISGTPSYGNELNVTASEGALIGGDFDLWFCPDKSILPDDSADDGLNGDCVGPQIQSRTGLSTTFVLVADGESTDSTEAEIPEAACEGTFYLIVHDYPGGGHSNWLGPISCSTGGGEEIGDPGIFMALKAQLDQSATDTPIFHGGWGIGSDSTYRLTLEHRDGGAGAAIVLAEGTVPAAGFELITKMPTLNAGEYKVVFVTTNAAGQQLRLTNHFDVSATGHYVSISDEVDQPILK